MFVHFSCTLRAINVKRIAVKIYVMPFAFLAPGAPAVFHVLHVVNALYTFHALHVSDALPCVFLFSTVR